MGLGVGSIDIYRINKGPGLLCSGAIKLTADRHGREARSGEQGKGGDAGLYITYYARGRVGSEGGESVPVDIRYYARADMGCEPLKPGAGKTYSDQIDLRTSFF